MNICTQCGTQLPEGVKFCPTCGTPAPQPTQQQEAPAYPPTQQPQDFTPTYDYVAPNEDYTYDTTAYDTSAYDVSKPKKNKKGLLFGLIGGGVGILAIILILCLCLCGGADFGASKDTVSSDLESKDFLRTSADTELHSSYLSFFGKVEDLSRDNITVRATFNAEDEMYNMQLYIDENVPKVQEFMENELGITFTRYDRYGYDYEDGDERYVWVAEDDTIKCAITYYENDDHETTTVSVYDTEYITDTDTLKSVNETFDAYRDERAPNYD